MSKITPISLILSSVTPTTEEQRKENLTALADEMIVQFRDKLKKGKIKLQTTGDFERIIKSIQAIKGEAQTIVVESKTEMVNPHVIQSDESKLKVIYEELYKSMNKANDEECSK